MSYSDKFWAELEKAEKKKKKKKGEDYSSPNSGSTSVGSTSGGSTYEERFWNALGDDVSPFQSPGASSLYRYDEDDIAPMSKYQVMAQSKQKSNKVKSGYKLTDFSSVISAEDFAENSGYKSTKNDKWWSSLTSQYGLSYDDLAYEYINNADLKRDEIKKASLKFSGTNETEFYEKGYDHLTADEVKIYNYLYATGGKKKAEEYLKELAETLNTRKAESEFEDIEGKTALEILRGVDVGLDQFESGMKNFGNMLVGKDDYIAPTSTQILGGMIRQDLADDTMPLWYNFKDKQWEDEILGATAGQFAYDNVTTASNMIPTIAASAASNMILPGSGIVVGGATMGSSAAGNAYQSALNEGYDKDAAKVYATGVGALEALLQTALGGISKLGGTSKYISKAVSGIDNALLRFSLEFGGRVGSEALEEGLQEVLDPILQNAILGADEDVNWEEVAYSALLGGVMGATMGGDSNNLSHSDQKVVNKVYEAELAKKKEDGKTLTKKEKSKIYDSVVERLEKGQIDIDTIDSMYGGEGYTSYRDAVKELLEGDTYKSYKGSLEEESSLAKEIEELGTKEGATPADNFRYAELMQKQKEMQAAQAERKAFIDAEVEKITGMRTNLTNEIVKKVGENSKLVESYREFERGIQAFEADLSKYTGKQREAVERAVKSGVLNNTYRSHELVDVLSKIEADKGITFDYTNNAKLKESGFAVEGVTVNGFANKSKGAVTLNMQSAKAWESVVGHEITHVLEGTDAYSELRNALYAYAESKGELEGRRAYLNELYQNMDADVEAELTADLVGDYLFTDKDFVSKLTGNRTLFQKIYDEIKYLWNVATGKEKTEIEKVKAEFDRVWKELKVNNEEVSDADDSGEADIDYSISVTDTDTLNSLNSQVAKGEYDAETNPDGGYYVTYKSMSFWGYDEEGNAILRSPMAEYVDGELSNAYLIPKDKSKLNWYQATETIDDSTGLPSGLLVKVKQEGKKSFSYLPASENQHLINEDWSNLYFNLRKKVQKNGKWVNSDVPARYNPYEHSSNSMLNDQFSAAYLRDNLVTVKMYVPVSEDNGAYRAKWSKDPTGWSDWKTGTVAGKIGKQKDLQRRVYLSRYAAPVEIVPDSEVAQAYKGYLEGTDVAIPDNVVSPNLLSELKKAGVPIEESGKVQYSVSADSEGNELSLAVQKRFANSKAVDENGNLKVLYHGTYGGEFYTFDKSKGNVEGDFGSGFYFTDSEYDVENNYEAGGPDFENKVARLAEMIELGEGVEYSEADEMARAELFVGGKKFEVYLNIENPAIVGETYLLNPDKYYEEYDREDYDSEEDYEGEVEQLISDDIDQIIWDVENNVDVYSTDGLAEVLWNAVNEGGIDIEQLKKNINDLYLEDSNGNLVGNEVTRQVIESLGYDGIIDPTVSHKWNMDMEEGTTHYIVFKPNQIKDISNQNPTDDPDIRYSLSKEGEESAPVGTPFRELALNKDIESVFGNIAPVGENVAPAQKAPSLADIPVLPDEELEDGTYEAIKPSGEMVAEAPLPNEIRPMTEEEANAIQDEKAKADAAVEGLPKSRKQLHKNIINDMKATFSSGGYDLDDVLSKAKDLSTFATVDNTPQRVMEKALGYKEGQVLADLTVNKVAQNETKGIKWLNSFTDRKNGLLAQISNQYRIKPGSKESAAAQMYAEGFYVNDNNDIVAYGDAELAKDFPDASVQNRIKGLASDPRIRQIYDETLEAINKSRARNAYPEIQRLENYFLHFRAMDDTFSKLGIPFNPNDIRAKDLPTDLNGVTADLKPGQPYFASSMHRKGKRTSFDLLGGLERYLTSAKNQIYHIDDIQNLRALRNYIADTYGQAKGLEVIDLLSEEEAQDRIEKVYDAHLSTFAKFLNEEANVLAGKTALIDRGLEGIIGRRGMTFLDTVNRQVGSNMVGYSASSAIVNFDALPRALAKTNKFDFVKGFAQMVSNRIGSIFGKSDSFSENSPVIIRRKGADRFYRTPFQKASDGGYVLMGVVDDISTEIIARAKYNELTRKGMDEQTAHFETDKWVSKLMGDRSLGQQPLIFNSKMLGLVTKFQLEVRNNLDSQFYDTIQEAKVSSEDIENALARNAKTAAKVTSTFVQLAVAQHVFGKAFESIAGYNPSFDIISVLATLFGFDDDEDDEDTVLDNIEQGFLELLEDLPYTSVLTGGRIPIANALPVTELIKGTDSYGNEKSRWETLGEAAPYYILPGGYGQIKKTAAGWGMFSDDHPVSGSYTKTDAFEDGYQFWDVTKTVLGTSTKGGKLRFPVEDTPLNRVQAALFGQYASKNAREYFDNDYAPLSEKQIQEYIDVDMPIKDYWEYREGLNDLAPLPGKKSVTLNQKGDYIGSLDLPTSKKNILINNIADRDTPIDMRRYDNYKNFEEFDFAQRFPEKYAVLRDQGISVEDYKKYHEESTFLYTDDYSWAADYPNKYTLSKVISDDVTEYKRYTSDLNEIKGENKKEDKRKYIFNLDIDYGAKCVLFKSQYKADDTYNYDIVNYINNRSDLSYDERVAILTELGFRVTADGQIYSD